MAVVARTPQSKPAEAEAAPRADATKLGGIDKAAILVMYLERETARELLRKLSDDDVKKLGTAIASVQHIPNEVIESVIGDFITSLQSVSLLPFTGRDFAHTVLPQIVDEGRRRMVAGAIRRRAGGDFEDFIKSRSTAAIAAVLHEEHPQVQAVALLRMGSENASRVLGALSEESQYDLTIRMARAERVSGALADDVEDSVRRALEDQDEPLSIGGAQTTARILGRLSREKNQGVLMRLRNEGNDLAERLQRLMVVFEDLVCLDDRAIQALLRVVERSDLVVALKGASPQLQALFLKNLSTRAAADLQDEMDVLGTQRKLQIRTAQENVTAAAQRLRDDGVLFLGTDPDDDE